MGQTTLCLLGALLLLQRQLQAAAHKAAATNTRSLRSSAQVRVANRAAACGAERHGVCAASGCHVLFCVVMSWSCTIWWAWQLSHSVWLVALVACLWHVVCTLPCPNAPPNTCIAHPTTLAQHACVDFVPHSCPPPPPLQCTLMGRTCLCTTPGWPGWMEPSWSGSGGWFEY
jgi:hypothetical protein